METTGIVQHPENSTPLSPLGLKGQGSLGSSQSPFWLLPIHFPLARITHSLIPILRHSHPRLQAFLEHPTVLEDKMNILTQSPVFCDLCPLIFLGPKSTSFSALQSQWPSRISLDSPCILPPTSGPLHMLFSAWNTSHSTFQIHLSPLNLLV